MIEPGANLTGKSLEMLEFPKIKDILAGFTAFTVSRELVMALNPTSDVDVINHWLKQSAEARNLLSYEPDLSIGGVYDIREPVALAARGKTLELPKLLEISGTLSAVRFLHNRLTRLAEKAPLLSRLSSELRPLPQLEKEIERCISPAAELLDSASEALAEIRSLLREKRQVINLRLDSIIKSEENQRFIQDPIVTERDGRYVIPLKMELRREIKGIVHDISNTGATAFIEPMAVVDLGNDLRELVIEEQHEVERILASLSSWVGNEESAIAHNLNLVAEIDTAFAKARFAYKYKAVEPLISHENRGVKLIRARHPLLKGSPVPLSIEMGADFSGLVITGPNTGGKTVALKTIGLLSAMVQAGLPIPAAHESSLPVFDHIFADVGDEQSIEKTLSTFSWHMGNIVQIVKQSSKNSLVLLDELGTATDPEEGAALAQAIILHFLETGALVVATTHFSELKSFAHGTPGLRNASLDFDPVTLAPTYHLTLGIPGGSNALAIAAQLGLPREIIAAAKTRLGTGSLETENLLADLMREKLKLAAQETALQAEQEKVEMLHSQLAAEQDKLKEQEKTLLRDTRSKIIQAGDQLQVTIREALLDLKKDKNRENIEQARQALAEVKQRLSDPVWQPVLAADSEGIIPSFQVGDIVTVKGMNVQGTVTEPVDNSGQLEIQIGGTKIKITPENLEMKEGPGAPASAKSRIKKTIEPRAAARELDLRGKRADEVENELETFLNDASLADLPQVRIIHGIGGGVVRQIVRQHLASHPLVNSFHSGKREEGGEGATLVEL